MFLELIATIFAGIACAGVAMVLNLIVGRRLPKWILPVAAGLGMLGMTITNEYTWFDRTAAQLPEGVTVAMQVEEQGWLRPWTLLWPYTKRFVAVDIATARRNENLPDQRLADLYFFGRWSPVNQAPMLFDCAGARSALLIDGAEFAADGAVTDAGWQAMAPDDPILTLICDG
ncbi:hypothetical protein JQU17_00640 [Ponticoccus sp. SC2-23]|uniref:hypothetical protein n=1 Tax=Alexandriicola marinus TaxID=2081710 RepID=UPI000FD906D4|nr:hypothetical protein [Alexandriicola marinus]MBM1218686.1 hypothetical protein [Ponticoccus sp. SC6-9]MBM1224242.1 hypothetical protein [Ponticoccus sp. SC6-15]MBM1229979.1 hypothetical protein [Ponticoccus sp. SC6-38]MBM1233208.1 hypothetical protein [Ponticoccus sp. SC6-45]MBM1236842.1 hypothetical protein [Ponticoccus sp. SC6-49]MBM1242219.1 hypothetical protein [Ponticoccus sp. SC2-64]MBM1246732.1 hypothetical protein [Ponticoccus sp. SC6-42]MBM1251210.1 hypothetical protein [Pontico